MHIRSNALLMNPARCRPAGARVRRCRARGRGRRSSHASSARPTALPSAKQRFGEGSGCWTWFIAIGTMRTGHRPAARPQERHRQRRRVVDQHLLARRDVELVRDQRLDQVPRQRRIAGEGRDRRNAPALVGVAVLGRRADGEGRQLVEEEVEAVVVVEDHRDVGLRLREPRVRGRVAVEEGLPVRILLQVLRDRAADGRDVRARDCADDGCHVLPPLTCLRRPAWP